MSENESDTKLNRRDRETVTLASKILTQAGSADRVSISRALLENVIGIARHAAWERDNKVHRSDDGCVVWVLTDDDLDTVIAGLNAAVSVGCFVKDCERVRLAAVEIQNAKGGA